jgi:hypothetical protein
LVHGLVIRSDDHGLELIREGSMLNRGDDYCTRLQLDLSLRGEAGSASMQHGRVEARRLRKITIVLTLELSELHGYDIKS